MSTSPRYASRDSGLRCGLAEDVGSPGCQEISHARTEQPTIDGAGPIPAGPSTRYRGTLAHNPSPLGRLGPLTAPPSLSGGLQVAVRELLRQSVRRGTRAAALRL